MDLTIAQKSQILKKIEHYIETRFFNPLADLAGWREAWRASRVHLESSRTRREFEERVNQLLSKLRSSHVAFFHATGQGVPAP